MNQIKRISLVALKLRNFKGIEFLEVEANQLDTTIYGANGAGKTTIADAITWVLFDKDSNGKKEFAIKTIGKDGEELHNLEHEVELTLNVDGDDITLKKTYVETYTKKNGTIDAVFTGHKTNYTIDEVPTKKADYTKRIASIVDESLFKLLTSPHEFSTMKWQSRRAQLFELVDDVKDEDVIAMDTSLKDLPEYLKGRTVEDFRKVLASKRTKINDELKAIPVRIDELKRLVGTNNVDVEAAKAELKEIDIELMKCNTELVTLSTGSDKQRQLQAIEWDIEAERSKVQREHESNINRAAVRVEEKTGNYQVLQSRNESMLNRIKEIDKEIEYRTNVMNTVRGEWAEAKTKHQPSEVSETCLSCGQDIPEAMREQARAQALAAFNAEMAKLKEELTNRGREAKEAVEKLQCEREGMRGDYTKLQQQLQEAKDELEKAQAAHKDMIATVVEPNVTELLKRKAEIEALAEGEVDAASKARIHGKAESLKERGAELRKAITSAEASVQTNQRIEELQEQLQLLAKEYDTLERQLFLAELFTKRKCEAVEAAINAKFKKARFKLFDVQINGGITDVCEVTDENGVPYEKGLNSAAQVQVGFDIINTLSEFHKVRVPIVVDNAESVTELPTIDNQVIRLEVSPMDKTLRVETAAQ